MKTGVRVVGGGRGRGRGWGGGGGGVGGWVGKSTPQPTKVVDELNHPQRGCGGRVRGQPLGKGSPQVQVEQLVGGCAAVVQVNQQRGTVIGDRCTHVPQLRRNGTAAGQNDSAQGVRGALSTHTSARQHGEYLATNDPPPSAVSSSEHREGSQKHQQQKKEGRQPGAVQLILHPTGCSGISNTLRSASAGVPRTWYCARNRGSRAGTNSNQPGHAHETSQEHTTTQWVLEQQGTCTGQAWRRQGALGWRVRVTV
jgi:hypothetical protein